MMKEVCSKEIEKDKCYQDVDKTIIVLHEPNKTVKFKLDRVLENKIKTNWPRRKAKQDHTKLQCKAEEPIKAEWRAKNWKRNRIKRQYTEGLRDFEQDIYLHLSSRCGIPKHFLNVN